VLLLGLGLLAVLAGAYVLRGPLLMAAPACRAGRWHGCYDTENGVLLMTAVALPVAVGVAAVLSALRWAFGASRPVRDSVAEVGLLYGTVPFVWMTLMPGSGAGVAPARVSLVPLRDLATMGPIGIGGNLLVLAALGFFAPIRFAALTSGARLLALGAGGSALIEIAQYALRLDRVSSVDDVLVNAVGAGLAGLASRPWWAHPGEPALPQPLAHLLGRDRVAGRPVQAEGDRVVAEDVQLQGADPVLEDGPLGGREQGPPQPLPPVPGLDLDVVEEGAVRDAARVPQPDPEPADGRAVGPDPVQQQRPGRQPALGQ
jgi:VanZ like family